MPLPIYVINLPRSKERRLHIEAQFRALPIEVDYQFFEGVDGKAAPNYPLFGKYRADKHKLRKGRTLSLGELGCFASHYNVWQACLQTNQPCLVIEDDCQLTDCFVEFYALSEKLAEDYEFLWLHESKRGGKSTIQKTIGNFSVTQYHKDYLCAFGYLLTPAAAQKFSRYLQEWIYPVDDSMARFYENEVMSYAVRPACIVEDSETASNSEIGDEQRGKNKLSLSAKLIREFFNARDRIKRQVYIWRNF